MSKPRYRPQCQRALCLNKEKAEVNPATQYVRVGGETLHVCGACANALAVQYGLKPDPRLRLRGRKTPGVRQPYIPGL